jgi:hypothetical protein
MFIKRRKILAGKSTNFIKKNAKATDGKPVVL